MSATPDSTLANSERRIADLERQLAEREGELAEALQRETATSEVLQVINSSPGDLAPVFEAILEKAHFLCGAPLGSLMLYDGQQIRAVATRGYPREYAALLRGGYPAGPWSLLLGRLTRGEIFQLADVKEFVAADKSPSPMTRAAIEITGVRTTLHVPLRKDTELLGYISAQRQEVRPFDDNQIALLQSFAAQAVIAMENARLITETREALEQQTATAEVLQVINSSPGDLAPVFDTMLEKAVHLCEAAFGDLGIFDGEQYRWVAAHGVPDFAEYSFALRLNGNAPTELLTRGERLVHLADVRQSDAYRELPAFKSTMDRRAVRSLLVVPLRKDGVLLGAIRAYRREVRPFSDKQIALMQNFAAQAVIAMENARLINETREALEQQTATAEVLQVINSSPGDLTPVFDAILEKAHTLCDTAHGSLQLWDGEKFRGVATRGFSEAMIKAVQRGYSPGPNFPSRRIVEGERVVQCLDVAEIDDPIAREGVELSGSRTMLYAALRKDDVLLGQIVSARQEVRPFSEKQIALVETASISGRSRHTACLKRWQRSRVSRTARLPANFGSSCWRGPALHRQPI
jgi:GAF domain-containing protein